MQFSKPSKSPSDLIALMKARGLPLHTPEEMARAYRALGSIGYYRLSGYMLPFQVTTGWKKHTFQAGTTLDKILALYRLDTALRSLCTDALGSIEVAMRTSICDHLCRKVGPHWQLNPSVFKSGRHLDCLNALAKAVDFDTVTQKPKGGGQSAHDFITAYYGKYTSPAMPVAWMIRECATFRTWAFVYQDLEASLQKEIAQFWSFPSGKRIDPRLLENWFHSLSILRNRCAHHSRITSKSFPFAPLSPSDTSVGVLFSCPSDRLRALLAVIAVLLRACDPKSNWLNRLRIALDIEPLVDIETAVGLSVQDWRTDPLWRF